MDFRGGRQFDAAYMLDIVHHIPADTVRPLLEQVAKCLPAGGRLVIKDVDRAPRLEALVHPRARQGDGSAARRCATGPAEELQAPCSRRSASASIAT